MGSPLSPIIADLVLIDIEDRAINILNIPIYHHTRLQFTLEISGDKLNFLDVDHL